MRQVLVYRLVVNLGHLASVVLFALAARGLQGRMALPSTVLFAWSPLMLFEFAGDGHNDALMLTLVLLAVLAWMRGWMPVAIGLLAASAMVKYVTLLTIPLFLALWVRQQPTWRRRLIVCGLGATIVSAVAAVFYAPWFVGEATFSALRGWTTEPQYANSPTDMVATDLARLLAGRRAARRNDRYGALAVPLGIVDSARGVCNLGGLRDADAARRVRGVGEGAACVPAHCYALGVALVFQLAAYIRSPGGLGAADDPSCRGFPPHSASGRSFRHPVGRGEPSPLLNVIYLSGRWRSPFCHVFSGVRSARSRTRFHRMRTEPTPSHGSSRYRRHDTGPEFAQP